MHKKTDTKLDKFLDSYKVQDADSALLESIVAQVQSANNYNNDYLWVRNTAMLAATAIVGFWLGSLSLQSEGINTSQSNLKSGTVTLDSVILGPKTLNELML